MSGVRGLEQPGRDGGTRAVESIEGRSQRGRRRGRRGRARRHRRARRPAHPYRHRRFDRVLGGGDRPGSLLLLGGEPGIGKSTLLLQAAAGVGVTVLYATGEESAAQVRLRAGRVGLLDGAAGRAISVFAEHDVGRIVEAARQARPGLVVVDLVQTATVDELERSGGSVGQVRESAVRLMEFAKGEGVAVVLVGHVTKDGSLAGPKTLEHLVDAVLALEGERYASLRLLRAAKNRFGSTEEVGVFEIAASGLIEVDDPARAFLADHVEPAPGSVVAPTLEGPVRCWSRSRRSSRRAATGRQAGRRAGSIPPASALLVAVLGRRAGIGLGSHDVYANLAGGLSVAEPGLDLPVALALASSLRDRPVAPGTVAIGEVGLLGELRPVAGVERRLREAARLGFERAIVPRPGRGTPTVEVPGLHVVEVATLRDAVEAALAEPADRRGDALAGDARLTARPGRARPGGRRDCPTRVS